MTRSILLALALVISPRSVASAQFPGVGARRKAVPATNVVRPEQRSNQPAELSIVGMAIKPENDRIGVQVRFNSRIGRRGVPARLRIAGAGNVLELEEPIL